MALESMFDILDRETNRVGLAIVINALQQLCFTKACELREKEVKSTSGKSLLFFDTGMALGNAVRIVNRY